MLERRHYLFSLKCWMGCLMYTCAHTHNWKLSLLCEGALSRTGWEKHDLGLPHSTALLLRLASEMCINLQTQGSKNTRPSVLLLGGAENNQRPQAPRGGGSG